ncbi:MAG TPA: hypothetical protein VLA88_02670 [Candidatus Saccharimonadales bacterium]|nr:hypothetical protein [Candidatus Saccharimonadales bacterium]
MTRLLVPTLTLVGMETAWIFHPQHRTAYLTVTLLVIVAVILTCLPWLKIKAWWTGKPQGL